MKTYNCDICNSEGKNYYKTYYNYGYCNNPECEKIAKRKNREHCQEMLDYDLQNGNFDSAMNEMEMGELI